MGRSRYIITEPDKPHLLTRAVLKWLALFTRPALVNILLDCWRYQQANQGLRLYVHVVLENHLHSTVPLQLPPNRFIKGFTLMP